MENIFTENIRSVLQKRFGENANDLFEQSLLLQYINEKTKSVNRSSKARSSFGSLYSLYTIIEDYVANNFDEKKGYSNYKGAVFSKLLKRARELPFGAKLQNHSFNSRTNHEFKKYFPTSGLEPILQDPDTKHYWINERLLIIKVGKNAFNISRAIIEIIDLYVVTKQDSFRRFIETCNELQKIENYSPDAAQEFVAGLLKPHVDARLFEIVSYSILKYYYHDQTIFWGYEIEKLTKENLVLYKTGRTNANDGGIDFVMKPLGRFFQVTETLDFKKYFLDIDKIQKYPITFVIKSGEPVEILLLKIKQAASKTYTISSIVEKYMACIEEVINLPMLNEYFRDCVNKKYLANVLDEIISQSKIEFNYAELEVNE